MIVVVEDYFVVVGVVFMQQCEQFVVVGWVENGEIDVVQIEIVESGQFFVNCCCVIVFQLEFCCCFVVLVVEGVFVGVIGFNVI